MLQVRILYSWSRHWKEWLIGQRFQWQILNEVEHTFHTWNPQRRTELVLTYRAVLWFGLTEIHGQTVQIWEQERIKKWMFYQKRQRYMFRRCRQRVGSCVGTTTGEKRGNEEPGNVTFSFIGRYGADLSSYSPEGHAPVHVPSTQRHPRGGGRHETLGWQRNSHT